MQCCGSGSVRVHIIFLDPDPFPGLLGSGSVSYGTLLRTTKLNGWKGKFNKGCLLVRSWWTYRQEKIKYKKYCFRHITCLKR